ncbi:MAG: PEGA domain-containing protein [Candidatus Nanoarchaeia archaeon]|nr:PEGA domain-containing protein [Candidatus Nanoarchaeia archaeon]
MKKYITLMVLFAAMLLLVSCEDSPFGPGINPDLMIVLNDPGEAVQVGEAFDLSWSKVDRAQKYIVQSDIHPSFSSSKVEEREVNETYIHLTLNPNENTTYYFRVSAKVKDKERAWSNIVDLLVIGNPETVPVISGPSETKSEVQFTLNWTEALLPNPDQKNSEPKGGLPASWYTLQYSCTNSFTELTEKNRIPQTSIEMMLSSNREDTYYFFRVRGENQYGHGSWSGIFSLLILKSEKKRGNISVTSTPDGADIFLNGNFTGKNTPNTLENLPIRNQTISVKKSGYKYPLPKVVKVVSGKTIDVNFVLEPFCITNLMGVQLSGPTTAIKGEMIHLRFAYKNDGPNPTEVLVRWFLSDDFWYSPDDFFLQENEYGIVLPGTGDMWHDVDVTIPMSAPTGNKYLLFIARSKEGCIDPIPSDDQDEYKIQIFDPGVCFADLQANWITIPTAGMVGGTIDVGIQYQNNGPGTTKVMTYYYLSSDQIYDSGDFLLDDYGPFAPVVPGDIITHASGVPVGIPSSTTPGEWYLLLVVGSGETPECADLNEGNNFVSGGKITITP